MPPPDAIIVLGCRVLRFATADGDDRALAGALGRRLATAANAFASGHANRIVASGGRRWDGAVEADEMAVELERLGVPARAIVRERCSMSTAENARYAAEIARRHEVRAITLVTCHWHLPRAILLFRREGLSCEGLGAESPDPGALARAVRSIRERICMRLDGVAP